MAIGTKENQSGATKPSSIEQMAWEGNIWAVRYTEIPSNMQMRVEYNADNTVKYRGFAARSLAEGTDGWLLQYFEYTDRKIVKRTIAYGNWTGRTGEDYA